MSRRGEIYYHYIYQNHGEEVSRRTTEKLDDLLYWIFRDVTFDMATACSAHELAPGMDIRPPIYRIQKELMTRLRPAWAERLAGEIDEVLTRNPFKTQPSGKRKLSLRESSPPPNGTVGQPSSTIMDA